MLSRYLRTNCFKDISLVKLSCGLVPLISADNAKKYITFSNVLDDWSELVKFSMLDFLGGYFEKHSLETISDVCEANEKVTEQLFSSNHYEETGYGDGAGESIDACLKRIVLEIQVKKQYYFQDVHESLAPQFSEI